MTVHYRRHPLYGQRVRRYYSEQRATGEFVHIEAAPGVVIAVPGWMLDPVVCAQMALGTPRVYVRARAALSSVLAAQEFRRSSVDG